MAVKVDTQKEIIFGSSDPNISRVISKKKKDGELRKLAPRIYTTNLIDSPANIGLSRNLVGINFRHPNVMPNFAVWKTITYRHWHRWCCQPRF